MSEPRDVLARLLEAIDEPPRAEFVADLRARLLEGFDEGRIAAPTGAPDNDSEEEEEGVEIPMTDLTSTDLQEQRRPLRTVAIAVAAVAAAVLAAYFGVGRDDDVETDRTPPATTPTTALSQPKVADPDGAGPVTAAIDVASFNVAVGGGAVVSTSKSSIVRLDARSNEVLAERPLEQGGVAIGEGAAWVVDRSGTLHRLDLDTLESLGTVRIEGATGRRGGGVGSPVAVAAGRIWVVTGSKVVGVDASTMEVVVETPIDGADDLTAGLGSVWVKSGLPGSGAYRLTRVEPMTGAVVASLPLPGHAPRLAVGAGSVWVPDADNGDLLRIDPATTSVLATIDVADVGAAAVAASDTEVWLGVFPQDAVVRIDPATNQVVERIDKVIGPTEIVIRDGVVWVASLNGDLVRIDTGR